MSAQSVEAWYAERRDWVFKPAPVADRNGTEWKYGVRFSPRRARQ